MSHSFFIGNIIYVPHFFHWKTKTHMEDFCFFWEPRWLFRRCTTCCSNIGRFLGEHWPFFPTSRWPGGVGYFSAITPTLRYFSAITPTVRYFSAIIRVRRRGAREDVTLKSYVALPIRKRATAAAARARSFTHARLLTRDALHGRAGPVPAWFHIS